MWRRLVWPLLAVVLLCLSPADSSAQQAGRGSGEFVLRAPANRVQEIASRHGLTIVRQLNGQNLFLVRKQTVSSLRVSALTADGSAPTDSQLTDVASDPQVLSFEPNSTIATPELGVPALSGSVVSILDGLGDTHLVNYFDNQVWSSYVDQPAAVAIGLAASHATAGTGAGIIAVIDTGVDPNHVALAGSLVPGYDFIHETEGASEWTDVDGSVVSILDGSVVSILDGSVVSILDGSVVAILDQQTAAALDPTQLPRAFGHGTMVAGLVHLVAPTAKIMPLKAFKADGTSTVFDVVRAIYYAVDHGARVINMSFSAATASPEITHAINDATSRGVICVASAGNLGQETLVYPGALRNVVGVGSTTSTTPAVRSSFSNYGDALVSVGAPGEGVITTYPGGHYAAAWGTSFSTPLVAGGASLLLQVDPTVDQGKAADMLGKAQPMPGGMGKGRLNLADAVRTVADRTAPSVAFTSPTSGGALFGSVLVSASASDNVAVAGVKFLLDGSPIGAEVTAAPFQQMWATTALSNGTHTLVAIARDAAGNEGTASVNITLSNDTAAPSVVLTAPSAGVPLSGEVTVGATATDDLEVRGIQFTVDGAPLGDEVTTVPFDATWNTATVANGPHTLAAIARDAAGHASTATLEVVVANDGQAPVIAFTSPGPATTVQGTATLVASASDDIGVAGVQFIVDGVPAGAEDTAAPYELSWNSGAVANGAHTVTAVARDAIGRQTTTTLEVTVRNDAAAPSVELMTPIAGASVSGIVGMLAAAADDMVVVGVQFKVDGVAVGPEDTEAPYQALWDTAGASNGVHVVGVVARDAAGHESNATLEVNVANDTSAPTIALTSSATGATVSGMVSFLASAGDDVGVARVQFAIDGAVAEGVLTHAPYQWSWNTAAFANGPHTITAAARDAAGHETTASMVLTVSNDNAAPTVALSSSAGEPASGMVSFVAAASDDIGVVSVQFAVDGMIAEGELTNSPYRWSWNTIAFENGSHTVTAIARDAAGHETSASVQVEVRNDQLAPTVVLHSSAPGTLVSGMVSFVAMASDDVGVVSVQFAVDGAMAEGELTSAPYHWTWNTGAFANGTHIVSAIARDAAGHETTANLEVAVLND